MGLIELKEKTSTRHKMWTCMRIMRVFTVGDLIATAETSYSAAIAYLYTLRRTGYVRRIDGVGGHRPSHYRLMRNSGPEAPRDKRPRRLVQDSNTGEVYPYA